LKQLNFEVNKKPWQSSLNIEPMYCCSSGVCGFDLPFILFIFEYVFLRTGGYELLY